MKVEEKICVQLQLYRGGSCRHPHGMVVRGTSWKAKTFPSMFAVIQHPSFGVTLFDTGYSARFLRETQRLPARAYRWLTPISLEPGQSAAEQLATRGISQSLVKRIVLSHLHADHIAGVLDFPAAEIICTRHSYESVKNKGSVSRLFRAYLPGLLPPNFEQRARFLETTDFKKTSLGDLPLAHDLFGDQSILVVPLPGHAAGQIGLLLTVSGEKKCFLIADAAWTRDSFRLQRGPHALAHLIFDNAKTAARTLDSLHTIWKTMPEIELLPSHCDEPTQWDAPRT